MDGCKSENAEGFMIFKSREADGAGSMENWYYLFDLCPEAQRQLLAEIFEKYPEQSVEIVKAAKIRTRVG